MNPGRLALLLGALAITVLLLWWRVSNRMSSADRVGPATQTPTVTPTPTTPSRSPTPVLHRLAGVARGRVEYAAVEGPDGTSQLYRLGDEVPGLGRLARVDRNSATINGPSGEIRLRVAPAPTASVTPTRRATWTAPAGPITPTPRSVQPAPTASVSSP